MSRRPKNRLDDVLSENEDLQRTLNGLFRTARREGWNRHALSMTVLYRTSSPQDRQALVLSAVGEGGTELSPEDCQAYGDDYGRNDVALKFAVAPVLAELHGLERRDELDALRALLDDFA